MVGPCGVKMLGFGLNSQKEFLRRFGAKGDFIKAQEQDPGAERAALGL